MQSKNINSLYAKAAEGIWVGNIASASDVQFLAESDISAVINLSGKADSLVEEIDYFNYMLPSQELMDAEFPKTITKLDTIMKDISVLRTDGRNILIHDLDGRNKCMLVAGYYLITHCGKSPDSTINTLEQLYFTQEQKLEEAETRIINEREVARAINALKITKDLEQQVDEIHSEGVATAVDAEMASKRDQRNAIRGLTFASFKKILRLGGKK